MLAGARLYLTSPRTSSNMTAIAFFDLDHTLVDGDSDSSFLDFMATHGTLDQALLAGKGAIERAYLEGRAWQKEYGVLLGKVYSGREVEPTEALARRHAEDKVLPMLFPGARALVEAERAKGRGAVLLTTTNQVVTGPVAAALGMDALLCTRLEIDRAAGVFTGRLEDGFCTGPGKAAAIERYCREVGASPADCAMFGDGRSDMDALRLVGEPVAVHPFAFLRVVAEEKGWPIVELSGKRS